MGSMCKYKASAMYSACDFQSFVLYSIYVWFFIYFLYEKLRISDSVTKVCIMQTSFMKSLEFHKLYN